MLWDVSLDYGSLHYGQDGFYGGIDVRARGIISEVFGTWFFLFISFCLCSDFYNFLITSELSEIGVGFESTWGLFLSLFLYYAFGHERRCCVAYIAFRDRRLEAIEGFS